VVSSQNAAGDDVTDWERHQRLTRGEHELDFGMMLEAKLVQGASKLVAAAAEASCSTALRVFVRDVARSGAAQRHGTALTPALILSRLNFRILSAERIT